MVGCCCCRIRSRGCRGVPAVVEMRWPKLVAFLPLLDDLSCGTALEFDLTNGYVWILLGEDFWRCGGDVEAYASVCSKRLEAGHLKEF